MTETAKKPARTKKPKAEPPKPRDPRVLNIGNDYLDKRDIAKMQEALDNPEKGEELIEEMTLASQARALTQPEVRAATVLQKFDNSLDINYLAEEMRDQSAKVHKGDMSRPESMLIAQAHSLDSLFANLTRRAHSNMDAGYLPASETYLRLALRAQNQCRATLETLSAIKNPPVVFAKQMNVSNGPQQVNNGVATDGKPMAKDVTHALENETEQNEMRGGSPHELLEDTRASQATRRIDTQRKAVGARHRSENTGGQSSIEP